jgi:hypothetical protein
MNGHTSEKKVSREEYTAENKKNRKIRKQTSLKIRKPVLDELPTAGYDRNHWYTDVTFPQSICCHSGFIYPHLQIGNREEDTRTRGRLKQAAPAEGAVRKQLHPKDSIACTVGS